MSPLALAGAVLIGLSLGLTGAGGSILTLPVLVYLAGVDPRDAVAMSLLVVGVAALTGAVQRARAGEVHVPATAWFSIAGMAGAVVGAKFTHLVPPKVLMVVFAAMMVVVGVRMLRARAAVTECGPDCRPLRCFGAGAAVGLLTGFLGVGGGFLLMPALVKFARLPLAVATGTSLAVIAFNAAAGWISHAGSARMDWPLVGLFAGIAALGVLVGGAVAAHLPAKTLRRTFGVVGLAPAAGVVIGTLR